MAAPDTYSLDCICLKHGLNARKIYKEHAEIASDLKKRLAVLRSNKKIVDELLQLPKIEQKSDAWYKIRQNLITASDFAQALGEGKFGNQADIYKKKVRPDDESGASFSNPFFKWGNMFEPVANDIYSLLHYGVVIHEFGLLPHPKHSFFGASPDGITDTGIMVEIKCPYKRKIVKGGEVPKQYYYQIQGQLEVCGLSECDYFECQFQLYNTEQAFWDGFADADVLKGVVIEVNTPDGKGTKYKYSPIGGSNAASMETMQHWLEENVIEDFVDIKFWYLSHYNLQRVTFDKAFFETNISELAKVWDKILHYRQNPDRYNIEVLKTIDLDMSTPVFKAQKSMGGAPKKNATALSGYSFIDDDGEGGDAADAGNGEQVEASAPYVVAPKRSAPRANARANALSGYSFIDEA